MDVRLPNILELDNGLIIRGSREEISHLTDLLIDAMINGPGSLLSSVDDGLSIEIR